MKSVRVAADPATVLFPILGIWDGVCKFMSHLVYYFCCLRATYQVFLIPWGKHGGADGLKREYSVKMASDRAVTMARANVMER